ncbi:squalene synthase HpnC [Sphingomonas sp. AR_OL41]|uniref:squalene synthase HpnC n=1 Tax=Sphingomonas sp. AR_OL41 TaxID=3042729 RepID=UPI00248129DC|nr:squalene synthase HpnC [Sphingomonas sp. AR_OL41]MDH7975662.1 squalene synthase HpnC [Sphingomonas sp. AR_OL41]
MNQAAIALASGKGHKDENFPVASVILKPAHRAPVMAFYRFARGADDIADNGSASSADRLAMLGEMRSTLAGLSNGSDTALALRETLAERGLSPRHGLDLLTAFERDCRVNRCADWDALLDYCRYSAMPVGRYVLDVHGESEALWPASDALCAALQVINHLQDCAKDYRTIDRVYLPLDMLAVHGATVEDLAAPVASTALRATIVELAGITEGLLAQSRGFARAIRDRRLALEVAVIHRLATSLTQRMKKRDPLAERVHHRPAEALGLASLAVLGRLVGR